MSQLINIRTYRGRKKCSTECRFCATKMDKQKLIDLTLKDNSLCYKKMLSLMKLDVDLSENNNLPKAVCMDCHTKCLECFNFFITVQKTQENLYVKYNNKSDTKTGTGNVSEGFESNVLQPNKQNNNNCNRNLTNVDVVQTQEIPISVDPRLHTPDINNIGEMHQSPEDGTVSKMNLQPESLNNTSHPRISHQNSKNYSKVDKTGQTYVETLNSVLDNESIEDVCEFKMMFNALSNDISIKMDDIQNIDSRDIKPVIQNNVDSCEEMNLQSKERNCILEPQVSLTNSNHYSLSKNITQYCTDVAQNIDYEECEMKPEVQDNSLNNFQSERHTQPKDTSQPSVAEHIINSNIVSIENMNQYDSDAYVSMDCNVKIEDVSEEINAKPELLSNTDNSVLPANNDVINDIPIKMEAVSCLEQELKSEIVIENDSNIDNLECSGLDMFNNCERNDLSTDTVYPIENIELVNRDIKTEIQNNEECNENYDSDTGVQIFEEDNPLTPKENDTMYNDDRPMSINTAQNPENSEGSSEVQDRSCGKYTNNSFSETLPNMSSDTIENSKQSKNIVETKRVTENNQRFQNVILLNNSINTNIRYRTRNIVKKANSYKSMKHTKQDDIKLLNNFLKATLHVIPVNVVKTHNSAEINSEKTCEPSVAKLNSQNNVTLLKKCNTTTVAHHGKIINNGEFVKDTKENNQNNVKLPNKNNTTVTHQEIPINDGKADKMTKGNNKNNIRLLNKSKTTVKQHDETVNNVVTGKEIKIKKDFIHVNVDGNPLLLQCSIRSESERHKKANYENESMLLNGSKATLTNDKNIIHDNKNGNYDNSMNNDEDNVDNHEEPHRVTEQNDVHETGNTNDEPHSITNKNGTEDTSKSKTPWRFDHDDVDENNKSKTPILWKKKYIYNCTLKADIGKIIEQNIEPIVMKEISKLDPDNEYLIEKSWETYPWYCGDCDAMFERVEDLRGHRQYMHKRCSGFWCCDCKDTFKLFGEFVEHVRVHRPYLRLLCEYCNQSFPDPTLYSNHSLTHQTSHQCTHCGEIFRNGTKLKDHCRLYKVQSKMQQENDRSTIPVVVLEKDKSWKDYEWRCLECSKVERDLQSLRAHTKAAHNKCFSATCADCSRHVPQTLRTFTRHVKRHRLYLRYFCCYCDQYCPNVADLTAHLDRHSWRDHRCLRCGESFENKSLLRQHTKQFSTRRKFAKVDLLCQFCGKIFKSPMKLRTHLREHGHYSTMEACGTCDKKFTRKSHLLRHAKRHTDERPHTCDYCKMSFKMKDNVRKHILLKHSGVPHICTICDKRFKTKYCLNNHKKYLCDYCGKVYKSRDGLRWHLVKHVDNEKKEICKICDKRFLLKSALRLHAKSHLTCRPYTCDYCNKTFKTKTRIRNHIISHLDVKPHGCFVCGKRFRSKCNLTVHCRSHTDARPYQCEKCDRKFRDCPSCDKHMKNAHGVTFFRTKITEMGRVEIDRRSGETRSLANDDDAKEWLRNITGYQRKK